MSATSLSTLVSPSLLCPSCRSVDRLEATSFLSAIGVGLRGIGLPGRALRFCIYLLWYCVWLRHFTGFLEYLAMVVLKFARAPGPSGDRGDMPLMATWG